MREGRSLQELAEEVTWQKENRKDYIVDTRNVTAEVLGIGDNRTVALDLAMPNEAGDDWFYPTDLTHQQLASWSPLGKRYYDVLREEGHQSLLADNLNYWFKDKADKRMVRTITRPDGLMGARAFLSDRYRPLDNYDLLEAILPTLRSMELNFVSQELTETRMYIKAVSDRIRADVKVGDPVQAGIVISNSEVGKGALKIEEFDYRLSCTNGMISGSIVRKTHLGRSTGHDALDNAEEFFSDETRELEDQAFFHKVRDAATAVFNQERFEARIAAYRDAATDMTQGDPIATIEVVQQKLKLNDSEKGSVLKHLCTGGDLSRWGLANAVTRTAEDCVSYDRATEFEKLGAKVIGFSEKDWREVATAS